MAARRSATLALHRKNCAYQRMSEFPQNTANSAAAPRKTPKGIGKLRTTRVADCHARLRETAAGSEECRFLRRARRLSHTQRIRNAPKKLPITEPRSSTR